MYVRTGNRQYMWVVHAIIFFDNTGFLKTLSGKQSNKACASLKANTSPRLLSHLQLFI